MKSWTKILMKKFGTVLQHDFKTKSTDGFLYGDIIISVFISILIIPFIIRLYMKSSESINKAYILDRIGQDVVSHLERGKGEYHKTRMIQSLHNQTLTKLSGNKSFVYVGELDNITVNGLATIKYTVKAYYDGKYIYEASTYVWKDTNE